jgi:hypothetical protein
MNTYLITNTTSGADLGVFHGADELSAYLELCHDASHTPERDEDGEVIIPDDLSFSRLTLVRSYDVTLPVAGEPGDYPY